MTIIRADNRFPRLSVRAQIREDCNAPMLPERMPLDYWPRESAFERMAWRVGGLLILVGVVLPVSLAIGGATALLIATLAGWA